MIDVLHSLHGQRGHLGCQFLVDLHGLDGPFGFADLGSKIVLERYDLLDLAMGGLEGFEHLVLGQLVRAALDHHDGVGRACHHEVQRG